MNNKAYGCHTDCMSKQPSCDCRCGCTPKSAPVQKIKAMPEIDCVCKETPCGIDCLCKVSQDGCGCNSTPDFGNEVNGLPLGIGYVPWQKWDNDVLDACRGLQHGTIFPELVLPFYCTPCNRGRRC
ncbi:spore coat associated protein CotJA [Anaeromicropila populeti]|uniref:Spore coat associated protein JA (CotJA) n=1 Tax=Anaeromicropila populeti TaxID=37658 RepID=A0A1I6J224_9FIRM|nr:spore coat associated protein CotJA [Anaeromicropila populeti]SFR73065.1 Spore coat associated protein JA (CotJA) [Anaeromicropila populeti]